MILRIIWDEDKDEWLRKNRGISFEQICELINHGEIIDILDNPSPTYPHQGLFVLRLMEYTWLVPFFDTGNEIKLITAFPSRKAHKIYGGFKR